MLSPLDSTGWFAYISILGVVLISPGTSVLLVVSQALRGGRLGALWTVAGDLSANAIQIAAVSIAAGSILASVSAHGSMLKWGAVSFLVATGLRHMVGTAAARATEPVSSGRAFSTGFFVSITNPTAILFFALLLPLFVSESGPVLLQFATLGIVALLLDGVVLLIYMTASLPIGRYLEQRRSNAATGWIAGALRLVGAVILASAM